MTEKNVTMMDIAKIVRTIKRKKVNERMFVITLSEVIVLVAIITLVGLGAIIAFLYRIAESFENRKNKRLENMWKEKNHD